MNTQHLGKRIGPRSLARKKSKQCRKRYKKRKKLQKQQWLEEKVSNIKNSVVRNFSDFDIPNTAYLYLARGLHFVQSKKANKKDLMFDAKEFIRKLEWKHHFYKIQDQDKFNPDNENHKDLRIPSRSHAPEV